MSDFDWWYRYPTSWPEAVYRMYRLFILLLGYVATLGAVIITLIAISGVHI